MVEVKILMVVIICLTPLDGLLAFFPEEVLKFLYLRFIQNKKEKDKHSENNPADSSRPFESWQLENEYPYYVRRIRYIGVSGLIVMAFSLLGVCLIEIIR